MNALETVSLFLGLLLGALCLAKLLSVGAFRITKTPSIPDYWRQTDEPPAVRVSPEVLKQMQSELIHDASKRILRADFQRGNFK